MIKIELYDRYDSFHRPYYEEILDGRAHAIRDERRLYKACLRAKILADQIDGKCHVRHRKDIENLDQWKAENDHFWVSEQVSDGLDPEGVIRKADLSPLPSLEYAKETENDLKARESRMKAFWKHFEKLRGLDMFAGAGGLSGGFDKSGITKTLWAVEFSEAGCVTLCSNLPDAKVYFVDANEFLDRAIHLEKGEKLPPWLDCHGNLIPDPPKRGEVQFILGGKRLRGRLILLCQCPKYTQAVH